MRIMTMASQVLNEPHTIQSAQTHCRVYDVCVCDSACF
jgi:hypothetical protein